LRAGNWRVAEGRTDIRPTEAFTVAVRYISSTSIVLKNPGNGRSSKNGVVIAFALFDVERAVGDAARLACRTMARRVVPSQKF
jgi:hypothetical protein